MSRIGLPVKAEHLKRWPTSPTVAIADIIPKCTLQRVAAAKASVSPPMLKIANVTGGVPWQTKGGGAMNAVAVKSTTPKARPSTVTSLTISSVVGGHNATITRPMTPVVAPSSVIVSTERTPPPPVPPPPPPPPPQPPPPQSAADKLQTEIDRAAHGLIKESGLTGTGLYRCGIGSCTNAQPDAQCFNVHLLNHLQAVEQKQMVGYKCAHCDICAPNIVGLLYHLKTHAPHRYFCYYCDYTGSVMLETKKHLRTTHKKTDVIPFPVNERRTEPARDLFVVGPRPLRGDDLHRYCVKLIGRYKHKMTTTKKRYAPDELDELPRQSIFVEPVQCGACNFATKVRTNLQRHLQQHLNGDGVQPTVENPVNPVPCLVAGGEKHFDKMINLADSSNSASGGATAMIVATAVATAVASTIAAADATAPLPSASTTMAAALHSVAAFTPAANVHDAYGYVPDLRRYVCTVNGCRYLTITETMLRNHLKTLHTNEKCERYRCAHCRTDICVQKIQPDAIIDHLRMHGPRLYRCTRCPYRHWSWTKIETHAIGVHAGNRQNLVKLINEENRGGGGAGSASTIVTIQTGGGGGGVAAVDAMSTDTTMATNSAEPSPAPPQQQQQQQRPKVFRWQCHVCFETHVTRDQIQQHMVDEHSIQHQFECDVCHELQSNDRIDIMDHVQRHHPKTASNRVKYFFVRMKVDDTTPIWRRDDPTKVRHIRGILFDDDLTTTTTTTTYEDKQRLSGDPQDFGNVSNNSGGGATAAAPTTTKRKRVAAHRPSETITSMAKQMRVKSDEQRNSSSTE